MFWKITGKLFVCFFILIIFKCIGTIVDIETGYQYPVMYKLHDCLQFISGYLTFCVFVLFFCQNES